MCLGGARIVGSHFYGPYFARPARGCHPDQDFLIPSAENADAFTKLAAKMPLVITVAPEIDNAEWLVRTYAARGVRFNAGHSHATFPQVEAAVAWGVRHVDHLFCAMSDRARLRQSQTFPMRAGVLEATLFFDELTTEVIADGKHLSPELLRLAYKFKGPDRLALVTDAMRAVDRPDGEYWFGPVGTGERVRKLDGVGVTLDGTALASGAMGMDHCVRTMHRVASIPLPEDRANGDTDTGPHPRRRERNRKPRSWETRGFTCARRGIECASRCMSAAFEWCETESPATGVAGLSGGRRSTQSEMLAR